MNSIAFVTTCKGRLHQLQQTLHHIVSQEPDEIIVVDYGCPRGTGDWVESTFPGVTVVRVNDDPGFCLPRARNLGAQRATSAWLCFIDADIVIAPGWVNWMRGNLQPGSFYRAAAVSGHRDNETWGTAICSKSDFTAVAGYDEVFRGWGGEDTDLYNCLTLAGVSEASYPANFVSAIHHDDAERVGYYSIKDKKIQLIINRFYQQAKRHAMIVSETRGPLPFAERKKMMDQVVASVIAWSADPAKISAPSITISFRHTDWLPAPFVMEKQFSFTLRLATQQ